MKHGIGQVTRELSIRFMSFVQEAHRTLTNKEWVSR